MKNLLCSIQGSNGEIRQIQSRLFTGLLWSPIIRKIRKRSVILLIAAAMCSTAAVPSGVISALQKHWNIGVCLNDDENILSLTQSLPARGFKHSLCSAHWKLKMKKFSLELSIWGNSSSRLGIFCSFLFVCLMWDKQRQLAERWN